MFHAARKKSQFTVQFFFFYHSSLKIFCCILFKLTIGFYKPKARENVNILKTLFYIHVFIIHCQHFLSGCFLKLAHGEYSMVQREQRLVKVQGKTRDACYLKKG